MKKRGILIGLVICLFLIPFLSAQPPASQIVDTGCEIEVALYGDIPINQDFVFHVHPVNTTTGSGEAQMLSNSEGYCYLHLYNQTNHLYEENMSADSNGLDWETRIKGANFSTFGEFPFVVQCIYESSNCLFRGTLMVTQTGYETTEGEATIYLILTLVVLVIFLLALFIQLKLPYREQVGDNGEILMIPKRRYLKILMTLITYPLLIWLLNLMIGTADYIRLDIFGGFFEFMFTLLLDLSWPLFVFIMIWTLWRLFKDLDIIKSIKEFGEFSK